MLEAWRQILIDLRNRGLTRVLLWVTDDFSGLYPLLQGLFPQAYHQLCTVHLLRNAQRHLSPEDYTTFKDLWRELALASSPESAQAKAQRIIAEELKRAQWKEADLTAPPKSGPVKLAIAMRWRREATLTVREIAQRLHMGSWKSLNNKLYLAGKTMGQDANGKKAAE